MGRIPDATIETIRDRIDVVELVGRHVALRKAGRNYKGLCPFHDEKTPSFSVNPDRGIFHCFGCGAGGNVFAFLMRHENLTFPEAARALARECGVEIPESSGADAGEGERLVAANQVAQRLYRAALAGPEGDAARAYLAKRGLDAAACERFGLGFAPDRWDAVAQALAAARIPAQVGERAGLLAPRESGGHYDRLRGRVSFPIQDARGRIVGFGGRAISPGQDPKYLNSPETPLFRKRESFYGFPAALEAIRRSERAVVVEGYFDRIALAEAGVPEAVATCGTALSPEHGRGLRRRTREVVLLFDGDEAGERAAERALEVLLPAGLRVRAAVLPAGEDPDSLLARDGPEALRAIVEAATPAIEVVIRRAVARGVATPFEKSDAVAAVVPHLARIPDRVERSAFARRLALAAGVEVADVSAALREALGEEPAPEAGAAAPRGAAPDPEQRFAQRLAEVLLDHPALAHRFRPGEPAALVRDAAWCTLLEALVRTCGEHGMALGDSAVEDAYAPEEFQRLCALDCQERISLTPEEAVRVLDDTLENLRQRRRAEVQRETTRRLAESPPSEHPALLLEKQRQLEQKRAARGLDPKPPAPRGGVELLP
ncbi:MAG TPA: DNA primase [Myxococcota bacterium]|nr:DNA primase [Myxococcota bacterium]